jgi:hypothetical protein
MAAPEIRSAREAVDRLMPIGWPSGVPGRKISPALPGIGQKYAEKIMRSTSRATTRMPMKPLLTVTTMIPRSPVIVGFDR